MENDEQMSPEEGRVREEEEAAAAQAGRIGGQGGADEVEDEAERPVAEGGGGEAEGFEEAEKDLVENAGDMGSPDPAEAAGEPEAGRSDAEYGEPDHVDSTETEAD
ncbi:MAG: hypothetical protein ACRDKV_04460 [Solirubrobacterales bacterium]